MLHLFLAFIVSDLMLLVSAVDLLVVTKRSDLHVPADLSMIRDARLMPPRTLEPMERVALAGLWV
jgi:hypothetical protein